MSPAKRKKKKPGGLTGKPPMSEPRVQLFAQFGGCNFQLSPRDFNFIFDENAEEQTDLMQNLMVLQNNAHVAPNKTIETRQNLVELFEAPNGIEFTGVSTLIGDTLYAACDDGSVRYGTLGGNLDGVVTITDVDGDDTDIKEWTFLGYADDRLVGMTANKQLWTGPDDAKLTELENAKPVAKPSAILFADLTAVGMTISSTYHDDRPHRVALRYTRINKYGPTEVSDGLVFYASKAVTEWSSTAYVKISGTVPGGYDITAVELYYQVGDALASSFLARIELGGSLTWSYNWTGYSFDTSAWQIANLTPPTENYTAGVPASMMRVIDGQLYFWGGTPAHRIWIGGGPGNRFSVSTGTGGGYVDCDPGTGTIVSDVLKFKTQQGAAIVTALTDNPNSQREHRFNLVESNISISDEASVKGWMAEKIAGTVGCKSQRGAVVGGDGLYAISRYGLAITTLTMEYNSQLQVQYVSDPIEPVFTRQLGNQLENAVLFYINGVLYMTFGTGDTEIDNVIFCYDIGLKAWWTHTLDLDEPILNMIHIDHMNHREGIGIVTADHTWLLPTTRADDLDVLPTHDVLIESADLSTVQPIQNMHHLSQLEFRFDYFIGEMDITVQMIDQFGREIEATKHVTHDTLQHQLSEHMRIDQVVESYKIALSGPARMRLTHFISKNYPKSNKIGMVYGFDNRLSHTSPGSIHRTFADYNDLRHAIIP